MKFMERRSFYRRKPQVTPAAARTSWEGSKQWYSALVGQDGHYYHRQVVLPGSLAMLQLKGGERLLDLGCGNGVLARKIPKPALYFGVDASQGLIDHAKESAAGVERYLIADACGPLKELPKDFTHATCILALQNMQHADRLIQNASNHLVAGGTFLIVINHPAFRIPRSSGWGEDRERKIQYRRLDSYMSPQEIAIQMHPSQQEESEVTYTFHRPLSLYMHYLQKAGFVISCLEEWCSDKKSEGGKARMEDRARAEFPLFLAIKAEKRHSLSKD